MKTKIHWVFWAILFFSIPVLGAETIYTWTDEQGIKRFSDSPPAEATDVETITAEPARPADEGQRREYLQMLEQSAQERRRRDQELQQEAAARDEKEKQKIQDQRKAKRDAERERLQQQIDALNNRALSPYFTQGMRQNQIDAIQKKIDALENAKKDAP
jgi:Rad3-related DNA helicase